MSKLNLMLAIGLMLPCGFGFGQDRSPKTVDEKGIEAITFDMKCTWADPEFSLSRFIRMALAQQNVDGLELTPEQLAKLAALQTSISIKFTKEFDRLTDGKGNQMPALESLKYSTKAHASVERLILDGIDEILLPHQIAKLQQLAVKGYLKHATIYHLLESNWTRKQLDISDDQMAKLAERLKAEIEKLKLEVAKYRQQADENILSELTVDQRESLEKIKGK